MDDYEVRKRIGPRGEYDVGVILLFDEYSESLFKKDLKDIIEYQNRSSLTKIEKDYSAQVIAEKKEALKKEVDLKFYNKEIPKIDYKTFKAKCLEIFSKFLFNVVESNTALITSSEFNMQFKVIRAPDRAYYFAFDDETFQSSDPENACFLMSGTWLIHSIVLPSVLGTSNFSLIQRYILHELTLNYDKMKGYNYFNAKYEEKIKKLYLKKSAFFLNCLYTSLFALREEGYADFNTRINSNQIDINMAGARKYYENLVKLSTLTKRSESEPFYENEIGFGNMTPSNEKTIGRNMCVIIALGESKEIGIPYSVIVNGHKYSSKDIYLDSLLSKRDLIYVADIDKKTVIPRAKSIIEPSTHYKFLQQYEIACQKLGISEKNMIMTRRRFYGIIMDAVARMKKEKVARLKKHGFKYSEKEVKPL